VIDDEVPPSVASVVGHVCGIVAVGMAALSVFGLWSLAQKLTLAGIVLEMIAIAMSLLMFRWAGALTGFWNTRGRLAVPKIVYSIFGALFAGVAVLGVAVSIVQPPRSLDAGLATVIGVACCLSVSYFCYLAYRRFK
jgi:hypothetical protein